jgi:hypothetical protein
MLEERRFGRPVGGSQSTGTSSQRRRTARRGIWTVSAAFAAPV